MKKVGKILLGIVLFIGIIIGGISLFMHHQINQTYKRLDEVAIVDLSVVVVEDGIYEGIKETDLVKMTVVVTVKDHQITDSQLTCHKNGKGTPAEAMIRQNTNEVDSITGATMSSKTIKASVRNAHWLRKYNSKEIVILYI